jgi:hypothetical protein
MQYKPEMHQEVEIFMKLRQGVVDVGVNMFGFSNWVVSLGAFKVIDQRLDCMKDLPDRSMITIFGVALQSYSQDPKWLKEVMQYLQRVPILLQN